ncbi:hypothetical protein HK405_014516, partial [Cladochytrium tenue]
MAPQPSSAAAAGVKSAFFPFKTAGVGSSMPPPITSTATAAAAATANASTGSLMERIPTYAGLPQTAVSLRQMVDFGRQPSEVTMLRAAQFLHRELPIRLARRAAELAKLPHGLSAMPAVARVKQWYEQSFVDLLRFPLPEHAGVPATLLAEKMVVGGSRRSGFRYSDPVRGAAAPPELEAYNSRFVALIEAIKRRHDPVASTIAQGVLELKDHWRRTNSPLLRHPNGANGGSPLLLPGDVQAFLDRFYMSRIGIRMLIGQHVALSRPNPPPDYVGIICTKTSLRRVALEAADNARQVCIDHYGLFPGQCPEVRLVLSDSSGAPLSNLSLASSGNDVEFMYVPSHLHHMLFELLKNSLRAVVERHGLDADSYPAISVVVAAGNEDITVKISDEGGGIPRSAIPLLWTYLYTTADSPAREEDFDHSDFRAPLAGFGYGLPLSRLYARYFGGDLRIISMEGYG